MRSGALDEVERSIERLAREGVHPDAVVTSPLLRARETAEELARPAGVEPEPDQRLAPGATAEQVRAAATERGQTVVVVGHQPDCSRIVAALGGGEEPAFPPGAMVSIELP
ncbi:MAG TPA: histidine phosphatase family protein [Gaiellaceae bacterium]|nr:histidine phosphatase family protein [Gaiellaceae bacterium]